MNNIKDAIAKLKQDELNIKEEVLRAINSYTDEPVELRNFYYSEHYSSIGILVCGQSFDLNLGKSIKTIKRNGCNKDAPKTLDEMQQRLDENALALKCARQAYLQLKYMNL